MEGITDPVFRGLVARTGGVAALCSEFLRVSVSPVPVRICRRHLAVTDASDDGLKQRRLPTAIQLMAAGCDHVPESAAHAQCAGADWIDLNFGCPAPVVFGKCAGSALLALPERMSAIVRAARSGTTLPVTAKIRAGITDERLLEENLLALAEAGAAAVTIHARLRIQGYHQPANWHWIAQGVRVLRAAGHRLPVVGNGGVERADQVAEMRRLTGCDAVMVGRAVLADPFLFRVAAGGPAPDRREAAEWPMRYYEAEAAAHGGSRALAKLKQQVCWYRAGDLFADDVVQRKMLLRARSASEILSWLAAAGVSRPRASCG
jgi:tRNA-dihydrouridine synthase C